MDYAGLKAEIALPAYASMDDTQIAAALVAETIVENMDVPIGGVVGYLAVAGKLAGIVGYAGSDAAAKVATSEFAALISVPSVAVFQCSDPNTYAAVSSFLSAFQTAGLISSTDQAGLLGMAQQTVSRAAQLGFGANNDMASEIAAARKWSNS